MKMNPNGDLMSGAVAAQLKKLIENGATVFVNEKPKRSIGLQDNSDNGKKIQNLVNLFGDRSIINLDDLDDKELFPVTKIGKGRLVQNPFDANSFEVLGIQKDLIATDGGVQANDIAWTHRTAPGLDIYFISNQNNQSRIIDLSLRVAGRIPELWDAVTGDIFFAGAWRFEKGRTVLPIRLEANGSVFIILQRPATKQVSDDEKNWIETKPFATINQPWTVSFDPNLNGPGKPVIFNELSDWSKNADSSVRYYSGTAKYTNTFNWQARGDEKVWLDAGKVSNIAEVFVNGINCGIIWTAPYKVDITKAVRNGNNDLTIEVTNTWANRIIGDHRLPEENRITKTNAPFRLEGKTLLEAGLLGPVVLEVRK
jgi:hypothetical protein